MMKIWCATFDGKVILFLAASFDDAVEIVKQINRVEGAKKVSIYQNPPVKIFDRLN